LDGDDEMFCDVSPCPEECTCIGTSINCTGANLFKPWSISGREILIFSNTSSNSSVLENIVKNNKTLVLQFRENAIKELSHGSSGIFDHLSLMQLLDLSENLIDFIGNDTFWGLDNLLHLLLKNLRVLDLSYNTLNQIQESSFDGLVSLEMLNIKGTHIEIEMFRYVPFLQEMFFSSEQE